MANVSANTLFHFTSNYGHLISILENGFYPTYCMENLSYYTKEDYAFPMVCFCDIPLTQVDTHTKHYGKYAIGLEKSWGMRNGITPILYVHENSSTFTHISNALNQISQMTNFIKNTKNLAHPYEPNIKDIEFLFNPIIQNLTNFILYFKPYAGLRWDKTKNKFNKNGLINFYNEKEWRFIPSFTEEENLKGILTLDEYKNYSFLKELNTRLKENKKLIFSPTDIKYILVSTDEEIPEMVDKVGKIMTEKHNFADKDIKLLITKITSMEQIKKDF